jgi:hypothetical protein
MPLDFLFFGLVIFGGKVSFLAQASLDHDLPCYTSCIAEMTGMCHYTQLFTTEMRSLLIFGNRLALRHISPDLHLPSIHDYIQEPQHLVFD